MERLCRLAGQKDRGFDSKLLAQALDVIDLLSREHFELTEQGFQELEGWAQDSARRLYRQVPQVRHQSGYTHQQGRPLSGMVDK
jgi:hypothetical protein